MEKKCFKYTMVLQINWTVLVYMRTAIIPKTLRIFPSNHKANQSYKISPVHLISLPQTLIIFTEHVF